MLRKYNISVYVNIVLLQIMQYYRQFFVETVVWSKGQLKFRIVTAQKET